MSINNKKNFLLYADEGETSSPAKVPSHTGTGTSTGLPHTSYNYGFYPNERRPLADVSNASHIHLKKYVKNSYNPISGIDLLETYKPNVVGILYNHRSVANSWELEGLLGHVSPRPLTIDKLHSTRSPSTEIDPATTSDYNKYLLHQWDMNTSWDYKYLQTPPMHSNIKSQLTIDPIEVSNILQIYKKCRPRYVVLLHQYLEADSIDHILRKYNIQSELIVGAEMCQSELRDYRIKNIILTLEDIASIEEIYQSTQHKAVLSFINQYDYLMMKTLDIYSPITINNTTYTAYNSDGILKVLVVPKKSVSPKATNSSLGQETASQKGHPNHPEILPDLIKHLESYGQIDNKFIMQSTKGAHVELYVSYQNIKKPQEVIDLESSQHLFDNYDIIYTAISPKTVSNLLELREMPLPAPGEIMKTEKTPDGNQISFEKIAQGEDKRTTCMLRNIPNKYTQAMLIEFLNETHYKTYDFVYLRMDFRNKCNVGYAFINFTDINQLGDFARRVKGHIWECFNTSKICDVTYANIQGKDALVRKFKNSSVMQASPEYRPMMFYSTGANCGQEEPFPPPDRPPRG